MPYAEGRVAERGCGDGGRVESSVGRVNFCCAPGFVFAGSVFCVAPAATVRSSSTNVEVATSRFIVFIRPRTKVSNSVHFRFPQWIICPVEVRALYLMRARVSCVLVVFRLLNECNNDETTTNELVDNELSLLCSLS